jgi:hypothetical protein
MTSKLDSILTKDLNNTLFPFRHSETAYFAECQSCVLFPIGITMSFLDRYISLSLLMNTYKCAKFE